MTRLNTTLIAAVAAAPLVLASPALAQSAQDYRIDAHEETTINLDVCSPVVQMRADGDNDTDLDYWLYDNNGNLIHTDTDSTDLTFYRINSNAGGGRCLPYRLKVKNYGSVYNMMNLSLTDIGTGGGTGGGAAAGSAKGSDGTGTFLKTAPAAAPRVNTRSLRVDAKANTTYELSICSQTVDLEIRGDGDTDLDFWITDPNGRQVHSDMDSTDITFATVHSGRAAGTCAPFSLRIRNYGDVYNNVTVKLTDR